MNDYLIRLLLSLIPYILILLIAIFLYFYFFRRYRKRKAINDTIKDKGIHAIAHIIKCYKEPLTRNIIYTYECQGKHYTQVQYVTPEAFLSVKEDSDRTIFYLPTDPQQATLIDLDIHYLDYQIACGLFILILIYVLVFLSPAIIAAIITYFLSFHG